MVGSRGNGKGNSYSAGPSSKNYIARPTFASRRQGMVFVVKGFNRYWAKRTSYDPRKLPVPTVYRNTHISAFKAHVVVVMLTQRNFGYKFFL